MLGFESQPLCSSKSWDVNSLTTLFLHLKTTYPTTLLSHQVPSATRHTRRRGKRSQQTSRPFQEIFLPTTLNWQCLLFLNYFVASKRLVRTVKQQCFQSCFSGSTILSWLIPSVTCSHRRKLLGRPKKDGGRLKRLNYFSTTWYIWLPSSQVSTARKYRHCGRAWPKDTPQICRWFFTPFSFWFRCLQSPSFQLPSMLPNICWIRVAITLCWYLWNN